VHASLPFAGWEWPRNSGRVSSVEHPGSVRVPRQRGGNANRRTRGKLSGSGSPALDERAESSLLAAGELNRGQRRTQRFAHLIRRHGLAEQEALTVWAAEIPQPFELLGVFDPLGDHVEA
jgi:hypothetical protein